MNKGIIKKPLVFYNATKDDNDFSLIKYDTGNNKIDELLKEIDKLKSENESLNIENEHLEKLNKSLNEAVKDLQHYKDYYNAVFANTVYGRPDEKPYFNNLKVLFDLYAFEEDDKLSTDALRLKDDLLELIQYLKTKENLNEKHT